MRIQNITAGYRPITPVKNTNTSTQARPSTGYTGLYISEQHIPTTSISFGANPFKEIQHAFQYVRARAAVNNLKRYIDATDQQQNFMLRDFSMEALEGLQYGINVFKGLTMKEIQYLSENLHVIAVKRGCKNMCAHCYADAKPQKREMSWEDFTSITQGFKTLRQRFQGLDIFGENNPISQEDLIYRTTELFYDADCMELAIKDKNGKLYDFTELATELYDALGRRTAFDTSGWNRNNPALQARAEKYAEYFSRPENMEKLNAFNVSFNVFNALAEDVIDRLAGLYKDDLNGKQKYIKSKDDIDEKISNVIMKINHLDTSLNSSGRMKKFMEEFGIKAPLQEYDESMKPVIEDLKQMGRYHKYIMHRLIDADGKVYHMNYARFIPTEIQLNIPQKNIPSPKLANLEKNFVLTKEIINRPEIQIKIHPDKK